MNFQFIVFQAIFLAAIQTSLQESTFRPGVIYQYRYTSQILTGLSLEAVQLSGLKLNCRCVLQIQASNVAVVQLHDIRLFKINDALDIDSAHDIIPETNLQSLIGDQADLLIEQLSKPLSFRYLTGEISDIRALRTDPFWSVNIKKGLVSLLHLNLRPKHGEQESRIFHRSRYGVSPILSSFNVRETDASGTCDTRYVVSSDDSQGSSAKLYVSKIKNFQQCADSDLYTKGLFAGLSAASSNSNEIIERMVHSDLTLRGDRENFLIESAQVKAQYSLKVGEQQPSAHIIQQLSLMNTNPLHYPTRIDSSYVAPDTLGLALNNPKSSLIPEVDPLAGREHYAQLIEDKLTKLVELLHPEPDEASLRKLLEFHHILRHVDHQQLCRIAISYLSQPRSQINVKKSEILLNTLPTLASPDIAKVMSRLITGGHIDDVTSARMLKTMSVIIKPTPDVLQEFMRLSEELPRNATSLRRSILPIVGTLANRMYLMMPKPPRTQLVFLIESVSSKFQRLLRQATGDEEKLLVIDAMSNLGLVSLVQPLRTLIENQQQAQKLRVAAIRALTKSALLSETPVHPLLLGLYMDRDERFEIRREAARILLQSNPSESSLQLVAYSLHTEPSEQLKALVFSYIRNLANREATVESHRKLTSMARSVLNVIRPITLGWDDSQEYQAFFNSDSDSMDGRIKLEYSRSDEQHLPQSLRASFDVNLFGRSIQLADFSLDLSSYDEILKDIMQYSRLLNLPNILHSTRTIRSEGSVDLMRGITTMIQHKLSSKNIALDSQLNLNLLNHRMLRSSSSVNASGLEREVNEVAASLRGLLTRLSEGIDINESSTLTLASNCLILPTPFGIPLSINVSAIAALKVQGEVKVEDLSVFGEGRASQNPRLKINLTPSFTGLLLGHMGTDMRWLVSGSGFKSTLSARLPVNADISFDTNLRRFTFSHDLSSENYPLVQWKHVPFTYIHYVPKTIDLLPYTVEVRPILLPSHLSAESMYRWSQDMLDMHLLVNGSEGRSWMFSARPMKDLPQQIFIEGFNSPQGTLATAPIRDEQNDGFWNLFGDPDRRRRDLSRQKILLRIGTRRQDGSNAVAKCEISLSQTLMGKALISVKASENIDDISTSRALTIDASLSVSRPFTGGASYIYQMENNDLSLLWLNVSWVDTEEETIINSTVKLTCAENLSERQLQDDLRALKMNSFLSNLIKKCSLMISFSELTRPIHERLMTWRDAIKYWRYPRVRVTPPQSLNDNTVLIRGYYHPASSMAGAVLHTPEETDYILADFIPEWLAGFLLRMERDDTETVEPVTVLPESSYDCTFRCETRRSYVCGTNGNTYLNFCHLRQSACRSRQVINVLHEGRCTSNGSRRAPSRSI